MDKTNTECRVCGKKYFCCSDSRKYGAWKSMACSPECYKEYMKRIEDSRKSLDITEQKPKMSAKKKTVKTKAENISEVKKEIPNTTIDSE